MQPPRLGASGLFLLRVGRQRRNPPIRRIHNDRSPPGRNDPCSPVPPHVVIADSKIGLRIAVAAVSVVPFPRLPFVFRRFFLREEFFPRKLTRAFERRDRRVGPY